jgi:hypothetical protein
MCWGKSGYEVGQNCDIAATSLNSHKGPARHRATSAHTSITRCKDLEITLTFDSKQMELLSYHRDTTSTELLVSIT